MPAAQPAKLVQAILDAIYESGWSGVLISRERQNPRIFALVDPQGSELNLWVYAWTLTPGGRPQLPHEYRIQMTTVASPLQRNPHGNTVLMGYEPGLKTFAGFDLERHSTFTVGSPSVQIDIRKLQEALQDGLAFDRKGNQEIAVGVRADQFMNYVQNAEGLHKYGRQAATFDLLKKASSLAAIPSGEIASLTAERQRIVRTISRLSRLANFRQQVLNAYGNRCAVSRAQLRLVEAAHVLPVGAPKSVDDVRNGIALAPTYHRAYDSGLIYLDPTMTMRINKEKEAELTALNLDAGLAQLKVSLGKILLPPDKRQWPDPSFIEKANRFRRIRIV